MPLPLPSNVTVMNGAVRGAEKFVVTNEYRRFAEFCDACRRYRHIGVCYGTPGVGKTLPARQYADWDRVEAHLPVRDAETAALRALQGSRTVFYTPAVVNGPGQVARDLAWLRDELRSISLEERERRQRVELDTLLREERRREEQRQQRLLTEMNWHAADLPAVYVPPPSPYVARARAYARANAQIADPTTLILIDEADRLDSDRDARPRKAAGALPPALLPGGLCACVPPVDGHARA